MSAAAYAAVREKPLSPAHEKKHTPAWVSPETVERLSAAFDVVIASSATEARRAANEYQRLCWQSGKRRNIREFKSPFQLPTPVEISPLYSGSQFQPVGSR
jgi:molybdopterin/thiamine biosynthesis adenylyltransferase